MKMTIKAKYIGLGDTCNRKDRWECTRCRDDPEKPECRFNLSKKKRGQVYPCRYCGSKLLLEEVTNVSGKTSK